MSDFYNAIKKDKLHSIHIYHSDVFYVRAAIESRSGIKYTLQHIESAMKAEGWRK